MDVASRFNPRARMSSYLDREGDSTPADTSGSGGESETNVIRRKFQRTNTDPQPHGSSDGAVFRKPSIPASATRAAVAASLEHRPSLNQQYKRRSTLHREHTRVPSGPREFPSPGKQRKGSTTSTAPSMPDSTNTSRSYFPHSNADAFFYNSGMASSDTNLLFANPANDGTGSPTTTTPLTETRPGFLPDVNFDDFQTSIRGADAQQYDPKGAAWPNESTTFAKMRALANEQAYDAARSNGPAGRGPGQHQQARDEPRRTPSLRERLASGGRHTAGSQQSTNVKEAQTFQPRTDSLRGRRQSSISTSNATTQGTQPTLTAKHPRKSVGPGLFPNTTKNISPHPIQPSNAPSESNLKSAMTRNTSLTKGSRRSTIQPATLPGAELPRVSTLTATTQSRQNKVKSLQPPPHEQLDSNLTPSNSNPKSLQSKNTPNRTHTPSSSGNRRQSMASGRASGLGARTISPTDARRLKRISTMNPPPMPSMTNISKGAPPTPKEELPNPLVNGTTSSARLPELPRMAQPSPSMIPRKTSNTALNSARMSPDGRPGGVSLSSKSSYSSLTNFSMNGSSSRLPTPKPRNGAQSGSSLGQYREHYADGPDRYSTYGGEERVPPVPAIPKAYESPKDLESAPPFFSSIDSSQLSVTNSPLLEREQEGAARPSPWTSQALRSSFDAPSDTPKMRSDGTSQWRRSTLAIDSNTIPAASAHPKGMNQQTESNGRKNANLQPLRLPPLNLMPLNTRGLQSSSAVNAPRPSQEVDSRDDFMSIQTPEPRRITKTPSTPMTASKATFFRRQDEANKGLRSSSSHYALRDIMGMETDANLHSKYWDDSSDVENAGVPIPSASDRKVRNTITPFSSGSLPKGSGEYARLRARQLGEYPEDDYENFQQQNGGAKAQGPKARTQRGVTVTSLKGSLDGETPTSLESPIAELPNEAEAKKDTEKKEQSLRRKISLGWRRSSSKTANHSENKSSPLQDTGSSERERERKSTQKQAAPDMPPPKLPASASAIWTSDVPSLPYSARPSLDSFARRKSQLPSSISTTSLVSSTDAETLPTTATKTRSQHTEQPTPVSASTTARASSWGNLGAALRLNTAKPSVSTRQKSNASTLSATAKDKDDLAADEEIARLSRKRKDVDSAARDSDELRKRAVARTPVSAEHALHDRSLTGGSALNVYERGEVVDFEKDGIYFTGTKSVRKIVGSLEPSLQSASTSTADKSASSSSTNFGYDDERGDYNVILGDHLAYRYEVVDVLGKGSFGQVVRCVDHKEGGIVAVKIIRNKKRFHQQALVEVGILGKLKEWDPDGSHATLSITSSFYFRFHLCIVTPCLSINLYELIRAHNFTGFSLPLIRRFARQLLACLILLQTKRIIHCDLKPENILLCEARKADVRVIDFGSSCREEEKVYTYIQSRFYRSPEVILGSSYGLGIDMWSLGCILAELWTGYPIFPGENEQEQLACIMEIFGPPDRHLVERCTRKKLFFDSVGKPRVTVSSKGRRRRPSSKTLQQALKTEDEAFIDFITRCLRWDPDRRLKPTEAVSHPFIANSPFNQRPGIPEEARRAARVRSTAAVPTANGLPAPSPVKRTTANTGNAFAQQQGVQTSTPAKERIRAIPDTPQTAVRNGIEGASSGNVTHGSPAKSSANPNRRHSTITTAGAAAVAGSKRASNGTLLGTAPGLPSTGPQLPKLATANLAQMAANAAQSSAARWKS